MLWTPFQQVYKGPYEVVKRHNKSFILSVDGNEKVISIDRLKPAYMEVADFIHDNINSIHFEKTVYINPGFNSKIGNNSSKTKKGLWRA